MSDDGDPLDFPSIRFQTSSLFINQKLPTIINDSQTHSSDALSSNQNCSRKCVRNCQAVFDNLCQTDRESFRTLFHSMKKSDKKQALLEYLKHQELLVNHVSEHFYFSGHPYCVKFFSVVTSTSMYLLRQALKDFSRGIKLYGRQSNLERRSPKTVQFLLWFKSFSERYGQQSSKEQVIVLPAYLTRKKLFSFYLEEIPDVHNTIAFSTFCGAITRRFGPRRKDRFFPWVRFSSYSSHSRCNICANLQLMKSCCRGQQEYDRLQALLFKHKERYGKTRIWIEQETQKSVSRSDHHVTFHVDSMDNAKSNLPHPSVKTKSNSNMWKLPSKVGLY